MSSQPPSTLPTAGISKSAAKKRAKKAAKAASSVNQNSTGEVPPEQGSNNHIHPHSHQQPSDIDSGLFNFPPGAYPTEFTYETPDLYEALAVNNPQPGNTTSPFSLPFPFDYSNSSVGGRQGQNGIGSGINITHDDLIQTANELYRRMADPNFGSDDAYWSSLPPHLRQFIREAVPFGGNNPPPPGSNRGGVTEGQQGMWTMAQQIVHAASQGMGLGPGVGANLLAGVNNRSYAQPGLGEELGFRRHPDAKEDEYDDEEDFDLDEPGYIAPNGDSQKKKNKKKKKKGAANVEPPPASLPPPAVKQPPRQPVPPHPNTQPSLNPPPPPATPAPAHPPPSSRAAGKQPMTNAPNSNPPARSARAAGKAPATATPAHNHSHHNHPPPSKPNAKGKAPANQPPAKIWTQSSAEDRENIRQFWLSLNEAERRDLLQIEKEAVLRKMKEQHRHSCGCAVCGRKKVNIESELDQLYEQYYDELQRYAAEQRAALAGRQMPPPGAGPFPGSVEVDATGQVTKFDHRAPDPRSLAPDDVIDDASEEYDDEDHDDEDDLEDEEIGSDEADIGDDVDEPQPPSHPAPRITKPMPQKSSSRPKGNDDIMGFGNTLTTIKGGILTVADDLLKNDGAKFLEMMEQLAVARSTREEQNLRDLQEETDDDFDDREEPISEAERMEEGKRMFQIFAARMFEQRVLQAYREKVAKQREEQLLRELEEEDDLKRAREEKKQKESQKKKDKKRLQKQRAEEEKAARDAAVEAEKQAAKAKAEEVERDRQRKVEEERARREAVKKAAQEEQARIAAERRKRQQEEKDREEEAARKRREREEKARKEREAREKEVKDREKREKEERLAKEKADKAEKERLAQEKAEKDRLAKEAKDKAEQERLAKVEEERLEKIKREESLRKEQEAAEVAKVLAQRERVKLEKAATDKAAAEHAAASAVRPPAVAVPIRAKPSPREVTPHTTPPFDNSSPVKASAPPGMSRAPVRPQQKTPQTYFSQPIPPVGSIGSFPNRMPVPQTFAPGYRPSYTSPSPIFSPPQSSANGPSSISPNPLPRGFVPEPSPPYDLGSRTAPIGMGFPPVKSARIPSIDEGFSPSTAPIGSRNASGDIQEDYPRHVSNPAPIAPLGPIGRPLAFLEQPSASSGQRAGSPAPPDQVLGSAALGADDEIVQPQRRNMSNGWDAPVAAAPGAGRWSNPPPSSTIWGTSASDSVNAPSWGAAPRQPSFAGIGSPFSVPGSQPFGSAALFGGAVAPNSNNSQSLPSNPLSPGQHGLGHPSLQSHLHHPHQHQHQHSHQHH